MSRRTARVVGGVGRTLIGTGLVLLLFVGYQLWGTGIQQARAQDRLEDQFTERLRAVQGDRDGAPTTTAPPATGATTAPPTVPPTTTTTSLDPEALAAIVPERGDPIARIVMPTIGVDQLVVHGVDVADLKLGPGHFPSTPWPGQEGNSAIAGHRTTYGQPFHDIDQLQPGDPIIVETLQGEFTYRVMAHPGEDEGTEVGHFIVPPTAVEVLDDFGDDRLTLSACHPKFSSRQRIIVTALLEEDTEPAPPTPTTTVPAEDDGDDEPALPDEGGSAPPDVDEGFGEGLGGDPDALGPATVWGVLAAGVLLSAWLLGQRWRRWPTYLLAAPVFLVVLFACFYHVDLLLPAY